MMAGLSPEDARADTAGKHAENIATNNAPAAQPVQEPGSGAVGDDHE
jgi:simple sugar transport system ATP-binding protein